MCRKLVYLVPFVLVLMSVPVFGAAILAPGDFIIAIDADSASSSPGAEQVGNAIDRTNNKYLNFGEDNSGFIVTPAFGSSVVDSFQITTANDAEERDPATWALYGTNEQILSTDHSAGTAENWTLIASGSVTLPAGRNTLGPMVAVTNSTSYKSHKMLFTTVKNAGTANSMQIAEIQFYGVGKTARNPRPADGAAVPPLVAGANVYMVLDYDAGLGAVTHTAYFSDVKADVETRDPAHRLGSPPWPGADPEAYYVGYDDPLIPAFARTPLVPDKTYYWCVDEFDGTETLLGSVWSFTVMPEWTWGPTPPDGDTMVAMDPNVLLSWRLGNVLTGYTVKYDLYYGTSKTSVDTGTTPNVAKVTTTSKSIGGLPSNTTIYWRVDTKLFLTGPPFTLFKTYTGKTWSFTTAPPGFGSILREIWQNITPQSAALSSLYNWPDFPENPTITDTVTSFVSDPDWDDYGGRIHGWLYAPVSGDYRFYLTTDDNGELWLSTDENPANAQLIASESGSRALYAWASTGEEASVPIPLVGGKKYYIGALWKERAGGDHCAVGWTGPGIPTITVIPGRYLMPFVQYWAYDPLPADEAAGVSKTPTLSWLPGDHAVSHDVYFGSSYADVKAGTGGTFKGNQPLGDTDYVPSGALEAAKIYYWKITEVNNAHADKKWEGPVWVFRVAGGAGGLLGSYYHHTGGASPAGFETFILSRIDPEINFNWGDPGSPDPSVNVDLFTCRWQGQVEAPFSEDYIFYTATDDGARLWVDGQLVIDQWIDQGTTEWPSLPITLVAGQKYDIRMEQYENGGGAAAYLRWSSASTAKQIIPAMWLWPYTKATNPVPTDGSTTAPLQPTLSWTAGVYAAAVNGHKVYFDANQAKVIARAGCQVNGTFTTNPSYGLLPTFGLEETYYWAVDEVNGVNSWLGDVWSFTTTNNKVIDDMEKYVPGVTAPNIYKIWVDGAGDCASIAGNNTGALVDIELVTYLGGLQAMKLVYDNDGTVWNPCTAAEQGGRLRYSKVEALVSNLPSGISSDWTVGGVTKSLSLQFYGTVGNALDPLWVRLTDASNNTAKVSYGLYADEDIANMNEASWHEWLIDLADFTGVNMSNVKSIAIGVGNEAGGSSGSGTLYFDDIRLYTPRCVLARREAAFAKFDYAPEGYLGGGDCVVNGLELEVMTRDWLEVDYTAPSLMARYLLDGNYNDSSGNGHHGTPVGAGITFVADVPPRTQVLDLPGGDNIYVDCNSVGISGAMPRTIACWAKADNTTIPDWTLVFGFTGNPDGSGGNGSHFNIDSIGGPGGVGAHCWGWEETIFTDTEALEWRHYAMTYDGTTIRYYGDGVPMDTDPAKSNVQNLVHADRLHIGKRVTQASSFPGLVDDACVFDKVLTDAEVVSVMNGGAALVSPYHPVPSPANVVDPEAANSRAVNFKDYAELLLKWLDETEWPLP